MLCMAWFGVAVTAKRWHDRNRSGWTVLIFLIPIVGQIWTLVECGFLKGNQNDNRFGPSPLGVDVAVGFD